MTFTRYAIYYTAPAGAFARAGAHWLGWDIATGEGMAPVAGEASDRPRKYGFHGTIKPPFALAPGTHAETLEAKARALCARQAPVTLDGLQITALGRFLAFTPSGPAEPLAALAAEMVRELDAWRRPATEAELERRRRPGMSTLHEENLRTWGYPHVMDAFRFHMTLTGPLDRDRRDEVLTRAQDHFAGVVPKPFEITSLTLCGERPDGRFQEISRLPLGTG